MIRSQPLLPLAALGCMLVTPPVWGQRPSIAALQSRIAALETNNVPGLATYVSVNSSNPAQPEVRVTGANLKILNGLGDTDTVNGPAATVTGGAFNKASGPNASVSAGFGGIASSNYASVSGGDSNVASLPNSSVSGGKGNTAAGNWASVPGGEANTASGDHSSISGGNANRASGLTSSVGGGTANTAVGPGSSISGGLRCSTDQLATEVWVVGTTTGAGCSATLHN